MWQERLLQMNKMLQEEIARSHQTVDNDPIQYDEHEEVNVEMYGNDDGQWSVKVDCTSDPSLSFPMQKFPDQASADFYARQCSDRIVRKKMNERMHMKKYSLVEQIYDNDEILTEGILEWIASLIGMVIENWAKSSETTTDKTVKKIEQAAQESLAEISKNELGKSVESFKDLDLSDPRQRKVVYKTQAKYDYEGTYQNFVKNFEEVMKVDPAWFPPEGDDEKKEWAKTQGEAIQKSIYAYGGFCIAELEWWKKFGFKVSEDHDTAVKAVKNNSPEFGSVFKWAKFIKETLNEQCRFYWNYAKDNLKIKEAEMPLKLHNGILSAIDKILPLLEEASKKKADDAPDEAKESKENETKSGDEASMQESRVRQLIRKLILEGLSDDLATVSSGREAKKKFALHVDQKEFKKGVIVHWVGSTGALKKILANPRTKDELSCNYYRFENDGGGRAYRDWMAAGVKKPIGVIVEGWVTYAGKENMFTGYTKRPRKKADKAAYDHRKASSGINKYPYHMWKDEEDYLEHLRNPDVPQTKSSEMEPYGVRRDLGDDAWMGSFGSSKRRYQDWNEVLVDNWKVTGVVYGGVGQYGLSHRIVDNVKEIARQYGFRAQKMGTMT